MGPGGELHVQHDRRRNAWGKAVVPAGPAASHSPTGPTDGPARDPSRPSVLPHPRACGPCCYVQLRYVDGGRRSPRRRCDSTRRGSRRRGDLGRARERARDARCHARRPRTLDVDRNVGRPRRRPEARRRSRRSSGSCRSGDQARAGAGRPDHEVRADACHVGRLGRHVRAGASRPLDRPSLEAVAHTGHEGHAGAGRRTDDDHRRASREGRGLGDAAGRSGDEGRGAGHAGRRDDDDHRPR